MRRYILLALMLGQTIVAGWYMKGILPYQGWSFVDLDEVMHQPLLQTATQVWPYALQTSILILFGILFCWVSAGFWTALMGFLELLTGRDKYRISGSSAGNEPIEAGARTAIVMPICNEDVPRVFAGLRATFESVAATGDLDRFDFFVLSDTNDTDIAVAEQQAWLEVCRESKGFRADLLPSPASPGQTQERQPRRLLPALGRRLPLHGRTRCRQRDERRMPDQPGAPDGGQSGRRDHPDRAESLGHGHPVCAHAAVATRVYGRCSPPACTSGSSASRTIGATTRSSA